MKKIILPALIVLFLSCNGFHTPADEEVRQAVTAMYEKRNEVDSGGRWVVNEVKVIRIRKGNDERHYTAEVTVKGVHTSPPLATPVPDEQINESRNINLVWRGGTWIGEDE